MNNFFTKKRWSALTGALVLLGVGCSSSGNPPGGNTDPLGTAGPTAKVRPHDGAGLNAGLWTTAKPPVAPPPVDIGDVSGVVGHWFIDRDKARWTLVVVVEGGQLTGKMWLEGATNAALPLEHLTWDATKGRLSFRVEEDARSLSYTTEIGEGVMTGRYAVITGGGGPASLSTYAGHVVGWRGETFNADLVPRVFDIVINDGRYARLRIDRGTSEGEEFSGELKINATDALGSAGEQPAQSVDVRRWDGQQLIFETPGETIRQRFTGTVKGRTLRGTMTEERGDAPVAFAGNRADILSYGLSPKTTEERTEWQERVRRLLYRLTMAGNPDPISTEVQITDRPVMVGGPGWSGRDDDSARWQQQYRLSDVVIVHKLPNPYGSEPLTRRMHGLLAIPTTPPPADGYPLALTVNGHLGSAELLFQTDTWWYGDAYARRGYVVFALDISHRPTAETAGIYSDYIDGDSAETGNHAHPAIAAPGLDSDWAEDGERAWDSMRGIDFLLAQENVNPTRIVVTGLSMGGEVTEVVGALDPRVTMLVPSGAPPDYSLMKFRWNHPCWKWAHGDVTEFIEVSDFLALIAPRKLLVETGKIDWTFSWHEVPFGVEKENTWRARIAYGAESNNLVHYLHSGAHEYRVGDSTDPSLAPVYIQVPQLIAPPNLRKRSVDWELDGETVSLEQTVFDFLAH